MKKKTTIALIVAAAMIIVGATLVNLARGRGENIGTAFSFNPGASVSSGVIHMGGDQKDYTVCLDGEESFASAEVRDLDLEWVAGLVNVELYDGKQIVIRETCEQDLSEGQRMRWKLSGGTLSVLFCANGENRVPEKDLTVLLPRNYTAGKISASATSASVALRGIAATGEIVVDTTSGSILVIDCACASLDTSMTSGSVNIETTAVSGAINVDATSGSARLKDCACAELSMDSTSGDQVAEATAVGGTARLHSTSGARDLHGFSAKTISIDSNSGDTIFDGAAESLQAESTSGLVELYFSEKPAEVSVETTSGNVTISFPKGTEIDLQQDTNSGKVSVQGRITYLGIPVSVDTTSGDITIGEH